MNLDAKLICGQTVRNLIAAKLRMEELFYWGHKKRDFLEIMT